MSVVWVHRLGWRGRTVRDASTLIHALTECGVVRDPAGLLRPQDSVVQLAVVLPALLRQTECIYMMDCATDARAIAAAKGRLVRQPTVVDRSKLDYGRYLLRNPGYSVAKLGTKTGPTRPSLYGQRLPCPPVSVTAAATSKAAPAPMLAPVADRPAAGRVER